MSDPSPGDGSPPSAHLLPNLGAEEGHDWRFVFREPAVETCARLWALLFAGDARIQLPEPGFDEADPDSEDTPRGEDRTLAARTVASLWPASLGPVPAAPVFDWLEKSGGAVAWLPTEMMRTAAAQLGTALVGATPAIVRRVHDKAFAQQVADAEGLTPRPLRGTTLTLDPADLSDPASVLERLRAKTAEWPAWIGGAYTLKPRLGSSGRGRAGGTTLADSPTLRGALPRLAARGGAIFEPWLERTRDYVCLLHVSAPGAPGPGSPPVLLVATLEQRLTRSGVYRGHRGEIDARGRVHCGGVHDEALREAGALLGQAAARAGYQGPCGVDAFAYRCPDATGAQAEALRPVVELNARFTTGFVALGLVRRALPRVRAEIDLRAETRRAFLFALGPPPGFHDWEQARERVGPGTALVRLSCGSERGPEHAQRAGALAPALLFAPSLDALDALDTPG